MCAKKKLSEEIEIFLSLCESAKRECTRHSEIVGNCDKKTTDYLHELELGNHDSRGRAKLATVQKKNLLERRISKDALETYQPLAQWVDSKENTRTLNMLRQALGDTRKAEKYHAARIYRRRYTEVAIDAENGTRIGEILQMNKDAADCGA